ncbi:ParA family protein [Sorangium sp. So ce296]|uniref:ParA family protein n=1 Tax=Sorangium sp. So ce296 TaxID=3133296 RepID=UPI003F5F3072
MKTIAFFNNKEGVGKTSLVYHLAWIYHELRKRVVAVDLDPQSDLTTEFLPAERLEQLWLDHDHPHTILGAIRPLLHHLGDLAPPHVEVVDDSSWRSLSLVPGDLGLGLFEDRLAEAWDKCLSDSPGEAADAFRVTSAFHRILERAAAQTEADLILLDLGSNLGAISRAALLAADFIVVPLGADLFSVQALRTLGPTLAAWRRAWEERLDNKARPEEISVPRGEMRPLGYVILQYAAREAYPARAHQRWIPKIPKAYRQVLLGEDGDAPSPDPHHLATLRYYRGLMPMAQEARKPMFLLTPADGAIGSNAAAVQDCRRDLEALARRIAAAAGSPLAPRPT